MSVTTPYITLTLLKIAEVGSENYKNIITNIILEVKKLVSESALHFGI